MDSNTPPSARVIRVVLRDARWPGDLTLADRRARHVHVEGRRVVRDGAVVGFDLDAGYAELGRRAARLRAVSEGRP